MTPLDPLAVRLDGLTLIEASAGTGKTTTITALVLRLLIEAKLGIEDILVVTFTRAATAELRGRVRQRVAEALRAFSGEPTNDAITAALVERERARGSFALPEACSRLAQALRDFDRAGIHTIHGFCQRSLIESAFESGARFDVDLIEDLGPLLSEAVHDYWARIAYEAPEVLVRALSKHAGPDDLARLALVAVRHPRMPVLPDQVPEVPIDDAPVRAAMQRAEAAWRRDREGVLAGLRDEGLNRNSYRETSIPGWIDWLDTSLGVVPLELPAWFERVTPVGFRCKQGRKPPEHPFFDACGEVVAAHDALAAALATRVLHAERGVVDFARAQLAARKRETHTQGFDDLLMRLDDALHGPGGDALARRIAGSTRAVLIDEFQDTDPVQYAIFRRLHERTGTPLFLIGDPKQAIYGFRGADVFAYMHAAVHAQAARHTLTVNHRSDPTLVRAVNRVFSHVERPFVFREIAFSPVEPAPGQAERVRGPGAPRAAVTFLRAPANDVLAHGKAQINKGDAGALLPRFIAGEIARLLASEIEVDREPIRPRHVAVLCRTNAQALAVQTALRPLRVPSVLDGDSSVFETPVAEELSRVLGALAQPSDVRKVRAALATSILGVDAEALYRMQFADDEIEPWFTSFARWGAAWHERGFVHAAHLMYHEVGVQKTLLAYTDGERRLTDLFHLTELLHEASTTRRLGPLSLLHWFQEMRVGNEARTMAREAAQIRLEHDEHAVRLTTIHKSKGLEYPIVFCPFLWADPFDDQQVLFHDRADGDRLKLDLGSPDRDAHAAAARRESIAEALRLCYVALTRARHRCFVVWGRFNESGESALAWLLHPCVEDAGDTGDAVVDRGGRLAELGDEGIRRELEAFAAASGETTIAVRDLDLSDAPKLGVDAAAPRAAAVRVPAQPIRRRFGTSSFTGLVRAAEARGTPDDGADHDEHLGDDAPAGDAQSGEAQPGLDARAAALPALAIAEPLPLAEFPAGARAGVLLHGILEHVDFTAQRDAFEAEARGALGRHGLDVERWAAPVADMVRRTVETPLDPSGPRLADVARGDRLDEIEFLLPAGGAQGPLTGKRLAAALARHGAVPACPGYAERVAALGFGALRGYLKGFVDLVFRQQGRFWVVDYKSNLLGPTADDYRPTKLAVAMAEHHYPLQYLLYVVALDRYLSLRLPGYDYETHFGGVRYLFVRGMAPEHSAGTGVFADRPSAALVADLRALFAGDQAVDAGSPWEVLA